MELFWRCLKYILPGVETTVIVTVLALGGGLVLGMLLAIARVYGRPGPRSFAAGYSRVVRSLPTLVVIFVIFFAITAILGANRFLSAVLALTACTTAYQSEIFRGAIQSLGTGQMQAARSLGMSQPLAIRCVIIPQAFRLAIPAWSNEAAVVLKDSSLAYAVGVVEILRRAQHVGAARHAYLPAYLACGLIYFCLTFITNRVLDRVERRYRLKV